MGLWGACGGRGAEPSLGGLGGDSVCAAVHICPAVCEQGWVRAAGLLAGSGACGCWL